MREGKWCEHEYYDLRRRITYILTGGQLPLRGSVGDRQGSFGERAMTKYARSVMPDNCDHMPETHVVNAEGCYRAQLKCRCGQVEIAGDALYPSYNNAKLASDILLRTYNHVFCDWKRQ